MTFGIANELWRLLQRAGDRRIWPALLLGLVGFLTTALYWPGIAGAAASPRWAFTAVTGALWLFFLLRLRVTIAHLVGTLFLLWGWFSLAWTPAPHEGLFAALKLSLVLAPAFCLGAAISDEEPLFIGAWIGLLLAVGLSPWLEPGSTFGNTANMAQAAALIGAYCLTRRRFWMLPGVAAAFLIMPLPRAALAAAAAVGFVLLWQRLRNHLGPYQKSASLGAAAAVATIGIIGVVDLRLATAIERIAIWQDAAGGLTWLGHGIGSFEGVFASIATHFTGTTRPAHAHNEVLHIAFELGPLGLILAGAFVASLSGKLDAPRLVLIALAVESLFAFPLYNPATAFLGLVAAGAAVRHRGDVRDAVAHGRMALRARLASRHRGTGFVRSPRARA